MRAKEVVYENDLEKALVDHLEEFLIELGHGFYFEANRNALRSDMNVSSLTWCFIKNELKQF